MLTGKYGGRSLETFACNSDHNNGADPKDILYSLMCFGMILPVRFCEYCYEASGFTEGMTCLVDRLCGPVVRVSGV
jgi:hypothetical protein